MANDPSEQVFHGVKKVLIVRTALAEPQDSKEGKTGEEEEDVQKEARQLPNGESQYLVNLKRTTANSDNKTSSYSDH